MKHKGEFAQGTLGGQRWALSIVVSWLCAAWVFTPQAGQADIFLLESGGRVEGEWLNRNEQPFVNYKLRQGGMTLALGAAQVAESIPQSPAEIEYRRIAPLAADTIDGQWELAEWCRKKALGGQRELHLRRILELAPNHQPARLALGYQFLKGQWISRADSRRQGGYELYRGKWRTPQEIEILEGRSRGELARKEWLSRLKRWRRELDDRDKSKLAYESLAGIDDPIAAGPIGEFFSRESVRSVKAIYADVLARIKTSEAVQVLAERALADADEEVFYYCVSKLAEIQPPHIADAFMMALKDRDNFLVNRGAMALGRLQDRSAISPLIDALTTTHTRIVANGPGADATTAGFGSGGTFLKKGEGGELQVFHVQNQAVLDALTKLSGADFGFDQRAWRYWYAQEKIAREASQPVIDARRQ